MPIQKLFAKMQAIADKHIKAYKEDFQKDIELLNKNAVPFVWLVRPSGTFLIYTELGTFEEMEQASKFYQINAR